MRTEYNFKVLTLVLIIVHFNRCFLSGYPTLGVVQKLVKHYILNLSILDGVTLNVFIPKGFVALKCHIVIRMFSNSCTEYVVCICAT